MKNPLLKLPSTHHKKVSYYDYLNWVKISPIGADLMRPLKLWYIRTKSIHSRTLLLAHFPIQPDLTQLNSTLLIVLDQIELNLSDWASLQSWYWAEILPIWRVPYAPGMFVLGWNTCSSCFDNPNLSRNRLIVPALGSSRIYSIDVKTDPRKPEIDKVVRTGLFDRCCLANDYCSRGLSSTI